jgi:ABC-type bacteriocin/lantibiotic exporter with double-glycine peptidase domain
MNYLQKLRKLLNRKTKNHLLWLVVFSVFLSLVEVVGVSAIMPFIDIAINFGSIHSNQYYQWFFDFFSFENDVDFAIAFGLVLFGFYIFRGGVNLLHSYTISHFTQNLYAQTTKKLFKSYLGMPYQIFTKKNSSYLTKTIVTEASLMSVVIRDILIMISEFFVVFFLYVLMLVASWKITLVFTAILTIKLFLLTQTISKKIKTVGATRAQTQAEFYEAINRVFGNFEHIKLQDNNRLQKTNDDFLKKINKYAKASAMHGFLNTCPRLLIETVGFSLIIFLLIFLLYSNQSNISCQH